ncbi:hypothetical protein GCM10017044_07590 [Kordiimonas sediminis]|uniref:Uncharacterized protein n=1 Tax=Kordiimonas sediminis TaxID=1735581 RepID=A0A919E5G5_9PROT|nr:hypothetical protein [Kordiimonas sediminis]GHF15844.1 hypothetical protein GCM10017044_07590 [Kordiimonas sediminis]
MASESTKSQAVENLAFIREMMEAGQRQTRFNATYMIVWGTLLAAAFLAQYFEALGYFSASIPTIWLPPILIGWAASIYIGIKTNTATDKNNPVIKAYSTAYMSIGITMSFYFFATLAFGTFDPVTITILACGLYGAVHLINGVVTGLFIFKATAVGWWGLMAYFTHDASHTKEMLLVLAGACIVLILVPAVLIRASRSEVLTEAKTSV